MERAPLPPHERTWRHPSEVAAEERALLVAERSPRMVRLLAGATGAAGLLAVGALIATVTPNATDAPVAISSSTTPAVIAGAAAQVAAPVGTERRALRAEPGASSVAVEPSTDGPAIATPIGEGAFAVVSRASLAAGDTRVVDVRLPSGRHTLGSIVTASERAVIVALAEIEPGYPVARDRPRRADVVTVMTTPPIRVAFAEVASLAVDDGTAVVDDDGRLVGICSHHGGGTELIEIRSALDDATSVGR